MADEGSSVSRGGASEREVEDPDQDELTAIIDAMMDDARICMALANREDIIKEPQPSRTGFVRPILDSTCWTPGGAQDPAELAKLVELGQIWTECDPFRSRKNIPLVPDPEEATKFEATEVLPASGKDLEWFRERLETYQHSSHSHWFHVEDIAPGSVKVVRISHADDWAGIYGKMSAAEKVEYYVEQGLGVLQLGYSMLGSVSSSTLKPIRYLTKINGHLHQMVKRDRQDIPGEPEEPEEPEEPGESGESGDPPLPPYGSLVPRIDLFLETNRLQFLPGAVYSMRNLSVLNLRDNKLISLLPSITHLSYLVELDLSFNCLQWLPYEIRQFTFDPDSIKIAGNPFVIADIDHPKCQPLDDQIKAEDIRPIFHNGMWLRRSTAVTLLDEYGSAHHVTRMPSMFHTSIRPSPMMMDVKWLEAYVPCVAPLPDIEHSNNVPSLMETVLRAASKKAISYILVSEDLPHTLSMLLRHTLRVKEAEGQRCSVCGKSYIIPRTEWIEWWSLARKCPNKSWVPFVRFGCSASCFVVRKARDSSIGWALDLDEDNATIVDDSE